MELKQGRGSIFVQGDLDYQQLIGQTISPRHAGQNIKTDNSCVSLIKDKDMEDAIAQSEGAPPKLKGLVSPREELNDLQVRDEWQMPISREQSTTNQRIEDSRNDSQKQHSLFNLDVSHVTNKNKVKETAL